MGQTYIKLPSKKRVFGQMARHPFKKVFDIRGDVDLSHILLKNVSVLCQQGLIDDSPLVLGFLEVRVREEEKHFFQLTFGKETRQVLHRIPPNAGDVTILSWLFQPQGFNPLKEITLFDINTAGTHLTENPYLIIGWSLCALCPRKTFKTGSKG